MEMLNKVIFSIVCPIFNNEKFIKDCVESVIGQTCQDWEMILVDDGSSDGSGNICDIYSASYKNIITIHKKNQGPYFARIDGVKRCRGDWVLFLDSDDVLAKDCLETLKNKISRSIDIIVFNMDTFSDGKISTRLFYQIKTEKEYFNDDIFKFYYFESFIFNLCRCCFNSNLFCNLDENSKLANSRIGEDTIFLESTIRRAYHIKTIPSTLYFYRMHENSVTHLISFEPSICRVRVLDYLYGNRIIPVEYLGTIIDRVSWPIINAVLFGAIELSYLDFKKSVQEIYTFGIYKKFFSKFCPPSRFHKKVAKWFIKRRYLLVFWFAKLFKKRISS